MSFKERKIFVVDDDALVSMMLSDHLRDNPMNKVTVFNTGEDCLKSLHLHPDVVILDYQLNSVVPNAGDGLRILEQIKKLDRSIIVIMLSSQDQYGKALQTIVKGAMEYVVKNNDAFARIDHILESA